MNLHVKWRHSSLILMLILMVSGSVRAQRETLDGDPRYKALRRELIKMGNEDQRHRDELTEYLKELSKPNTTRSMEKFAALVKKQDTIDKRNVKRLMMIVNRYGWPTRSTVGKEASEAAFLIVQHADLASQKRYFPLLKAAVARNEARPDHAAMMEDRILMGEGKKQIYGTGLRTDDVTKELKLWPIENEDEVDVRRAKVGLPPMAAFLMMVGLEYTPFRKKN